VERDLIGLVAGFVIATITAPVGVSGAVFLLPIQLSVLDVPNPRVTPTNLLYNVISGPGALFRYFRQRHLDGGLTRSLIVGSAPGVVIGAFLRVHVADDPSVFRLVAAGVLLPTGLVILVTSKRGRTASGENDPDRSAPPEGAGLSRRSISGLAFVVGIVGGIYGIGGGSILGPILVGTGMTITRVAPAALASTWVTSIIGVVAYAVIALDTPGTIAPDWTLGVATGIGGIIGGYTGACLQPRLPELLLRTVLGLLAISLAVVYVVQALI
jgi:uncharacterized membrane protein YfcA